MLELNTVLADRYIVQRHLASGGTADLYGVFDTNLSVHRVVKVAARPTPETAARWLRVERELLEAARSPFFPGVYDWIECPAALVLEYCFGKPLDAITVPPHSTALLAVLRRLTELVLAVHEHGYVYRDLKPANVIVPDTRAQPWRLIDFGSACRVGAVGESLGTAGFAAPEVMTGASVDAASDIYSLGRCLAWSTERAAGGRSPLVQAFEEALSDMEPSRRPLGSDLMAQLEDAWLVEAWTTPGGVCASCLELLSHDPVRRECSCAGPPLELEVVHQAAARLIRWANARGEAGVAAWISERVHGPGALTDAERLHLARWHQRAGRVREALATISPDGNTTKSPPDSLAALHLRLLHDVAGPDSALDAIRRWPHLAASVQWARNAAQVLARHGHTPEATDLLHSTLRTHPNDGPCHALLAHLLPPGKDREEHVRRAASGDPPDPDSVRSAAQTLLSNAQGRERAITLVREALAKAPRDRSIRRLLADISLVEARTWPRLETELKAWLAEEHDDSLLECLVDLYVRSERWGQLISPTLPTARGPGARALVSLARAVASRDPGELARLDQLPWELASPLRWMQSVSEAVAAAARGGQAVRARRWLTGLPPSFTPYSADLERFLSP